MGAKNLACKNVLFSESLTTSENHREPPLGPSERMKPRYTLAELLATAPLELDQTPEMIEWDRMPAVGREWPNPGWDEDPSSPIEHGELGPVAP